MKFSKQKYDEIASFILEKISNDGTGISKAVVENFNVSRSTAVNIINKLIEDNIIDKVQRDKYTLKRTSFRTQLYRSEGQLKDETYIYEQHVAPLLKDCNENSQIIWEYAFSEIMNNAIEHSGANAVIINVSKSYINTIISVLDDGIGIFKKIMEFYNLNSIEEARTELFKGKVTTDSSRHSGEGIFFTSRIMDLFFITSDKEVFMIDKFNESASTHDEFFDQNGTFVYMELSNHTNKELTDVFNQYSNVDDGFSKTSIPVKFFFEKSPVSRSQARRLVSNLDKFSEIELDFDGVPTMGQGFAHELFVVFVKNHDDIKVTPINMNENVSSMYNHVIKTKL